MSHDTEQFIEQPEADPFVEHAGSSHEVMPSEQAHSGVAEQGGYDPDGSITAALAAVEQARAAHAQPAAESTEPGNGQTPDIQAEHDVSPLSPQEVLDRHVLSTDHTEDHMSRVVNGAKEVLDVGSQVLRMFQNRAGR